jgi:hypothetical protein
LLKKKVRKAKKYYKNIETGKTHWHLPEGGIVIQQFTKHEHADGRIYYKNFETGSTCSYLPEGGEVIHPLHIVPGKDLIFTKKVSKDGREYYKNTVTGKKLWNLPKGATVVSSKAKPSQQVMQHIRQSLAEVNVKNSEVSHLTDAEKKVREIEKLRESLKAIHAAIEARNFERKHNVDQSASARLQDIEHHMEWVATTKIVTTQIEAMARKKGAIARTTLAKNRSDQAGEVFVELEPEFSLKTEFETAPSGTGVRVKVFGLLEFGQSPLQAQGVIEGMHLIEINGHNVLTKSLTEVNEIVATAKKSKIGTTMLFREEVNDDEDNDDEDNEDVTEIFANEHI